MSPIDFSRIYISGDIYNRIKKIFFRLEDESLYSAEKVYKVDYDWPGDNEGRTILAMSLLGQTYHARPKYLDDIMQILPKKLNKRGYFGNILPEGYFDEQQLSGNSWFLRGVIEYYLWTNDNKVLKMIDALVKNLLLPLKGNMDSYPSKPECRKLEGEAMGTLYKKPIGNWYLSTDIGCVFIMLDGATQAYEVLRNEELKELIYEMIARFLSMDILKLSFQTHATLSALRGILRFYSLTGEIELLNKVEEIFNVYIQEGVTENYENYNWFGRAAWTEPCAIIDSFIVATELWQHTGKASYLDISHNILYNAIEHGQRPNGGFGCDVCSGVEHEFLYALKDVFEAYWCCTMRGGEGLSKVAQYSYFLEGDEITVPFFNNNTSKFCFEDGELILKQTTSYPYEGKVCLEVVYSSLKSSKKIKLLFPEWASDYTISINGETIIHNEYNGFVSFDTSLENNDSLEFTFNINLRIEKSINHNSIEEKITFRHGSLILGVINNEAVLIISEEDKWKYLGKGMYRREGNGMILEPINNMAYLDDDSAKNRKVQILFEEGALCHGK
jgi:uncharacterized protein